MSEIEELVKQAISDVPPTSVNVTDQTKINPAVMNALMAMASAGQLARIRKNLEDRTSKGIVWPYNNLTVTPAGEEVRLPVPGQAIAIINDGPAAIQVGINDRINLQTVLANAPYNVNFEAHKLIFFFVRCAAGLTATARVTIKA